MFTQQWSNVSHLVRTLRMYHIPICNHQKLGCATWITWASGQGCVTASQTMSDHITRLTKPSRFFACNVEKCPQPSLLPGGWPYEVHTRLVLWVLSADFIGWKLAVFKPLQKSSMTADCNVPQLVAQEDGSMIVPTFNWTDFFIIFCSIVCFLFLFLLFLSVLMLASDWEVDWSWSRGILALGVCWMNHDIIVQ